VYEAPLLHSGFLICLSLNARISQLLLS